MQTAYQEHPDLYLEGQIVRADLVISKIAGAAIRMGRPCYHIDGDDAEETNPMTDISAQDVDSIILTGVSTAGTQLYVPGGGTGLDFDGAGIGGTDGLITPVARNLRIVFNNHGDWDATTGIARGLDPYAQYMEENSSIATSADLTGIRLFRKLYSYFVPAQTGTNGTFTLGVGTLLGPLMGDVFHGIAAFDASHPQAATPVGYSQYEAVTILRKGVVAVLAEVAVEPGDPVYSRFVVGGGEVIGALGNIPDGTPATAPDCAPVAKAKWLTSTGAASVGLIEVDFS